MAAQDLLLMYLPIVVAKDMHIRFILCKAKIDQMKYYVQRCSYLHSLNFAAMRSKQKQRMVQQILLSCIHFVMRTAILNISNSLITILSYVSDILFIWFLLKFSFKKETNAKIGCATALKLLLYKPNSLIVIIVLSSIFNKPQIKTINWLEFRLIGSFVITTWVWDKLYFVIYSKDELRREETSS